KCYISGTAEAVDLDGGYFVTGFTNREAGHRGMTAAFVPLNYEGVEITKRFENMGRMAISTGGFQMTDVHIPEATRATMENLGITQVAEEMGINVSYFEEEEWVTVEPEKSKWWPEGLKIPKTVYEAERIILTPILRSHTTATFTCSLKLGVGIIDAEERDWLHDGKDFYEKMIDINLAYHADMIIADALRMNTGKGTAPEDEVKPGIITASNNMVASDAVSAALMQRYRTVRVVDHSTQGLTQFTLAEKLDLGVPNLSGIHLEHNNMANDDGFQELLGYIKSELR
ncbi:DUF362 domain-containing protein, partial [Candidatus Bathyarchaeota archaeon]|nr:DUF362 domain-containing protein [Candidatus Bathyarchaeota archaeon]